MTGLLDTHCFLWAAIAPEKLSLTVRGALTDRTNSIYLSTVSFWEISLKFGLGKLRLTGCTPEDLVGVSQEMGIEIVTPSAEESAGFHRPPKVAHKDPFDRMLIWQCLQNGWTLITRDREMDEYRNLGLKTLW